MRSLQSRRGSVEIFRRMLRHDDKVQVIGLCGNSGNSSEPMLQYHLQNTGNIEEATGIKVYFDELKVKHKKEDREEKNYSPIREDIVTGE